MMLIQRIIGALKDGLKRQQLTFCHDAERSRIVGLSQREKPFARAQMKKSLAAVTCFILFLSFPVPTLCAPSSSIPRRTAPSARTIRRAVHDHWVPEDAEPSATGPFRAACMPDLLRIVEGRTGFIRLTPLGGVPVYRVEVASTSLPGTAETRIRFDVARKPTIVEYTSTDVGGPYRTDRDVLTLRVSFLIWPQGMGTGKPTLEKILTMECPVEVLHTVPD